MRYYYDEENETRQMSRSEKIREVKSAFSQNSGRTGVSDGVWDEEMLLDRGRHQLGMLRMVIAGVLFFVMVLSFHYGVSYKNYDKAYVEQLLSDSSHWDNLVNKVAQAMKQVK